MTRTLIPRILSRVKKTIRRHGMISAGDQVGVAVSGGIDSVALLDILVQLRTELGISLLVLHLNHGIRGDEAARDQQFVHEMSEQYALPFLDKTVDVPGYMREESLSPQEAARELRYRFFEEAVKTHALDKVAVGQIADDQAETVLMRFITGGGTRGFMGMPPVRGAKYIRPLIECWREELQEYAQHQGLSFVQDSSNRKSIYLRNRIRHELLPYLKKYNPNIKERLVQLAQILDEDHSYLEALAQGAVHGTVTGEKEISIPIPQLLSLPPALQARALQRAFMHLSSGKVLAHPHLKGIVRMVRQGGGSKRIMLPGGFWAVRVYDTLFLKNGKGEEGARVNETTLRIPGRTPLEGFEMAIEATIDEGRSSPGSDRREAYLDYDRLSFPLRVRSYRPGDRFIPLGMKGKKKLKVFFIDQKIPHEQRGSVPVVTTGGDICWVAGWRIDERFKIGMETKKTLRLTMIPL